MMRGVKTKSHEYKHQVFSAKKALLFFSFATKLQKEEFAC